MLFLNIFIVLVLCRYMQVGNAAAVLVARALVCSLAKAYKGESDVDQPLFELPASFGLLDQAAAKKIVCKSY